MAERGYATFGSMINFVALRKRGISPVLRKFLMAAQTTAICVPHGFEKPTIESIRIRGFVVGNGEHSIFNVLVIEWLAQVDRLLLGQDCAIRDDVMVCVTPLKGSVA